MSLLGIDIGTTHIKVGLFSIEGDLLRLAIRENKHFLTEQGHSYYDPKTLWNLVAMAIKEVTMDDVEIQSIGITSMAESGLLIDIESGDEQSHIIPWFDQRTEHIVKDVVQEIDPIEHFKKTGLHPSYKQGLFKILWLLQDNIQLTRYSTWLSVADYIAYKLTGKIGTDDSLAARTYAYRIDTKEWDQPFLRYFNLDRFLFPTVYPSGWKLGEVDHGLDKIGLKKGIPVAVSGHDHICASLAVGAVKPEIISNSIGTAETLVGTINNLTLTVREYQSGFNFGCHVAPSRYFWLGSIQSSGGSIEWFRKQFGEKKLSYDDLTDLLSDIPNIPTGILYYPYLAGSGAPNPNPQAKASFIGLDSDHTKAEMLRAIYEGTSYELRRLIETVEDLFDMNINQLITVGGGTKNADWMQIRADVTNCQLTIPAIKEASLLGAALIAGLGSGVYRTEEELLKVVSAIQSENISPITSHQATYQKLFNGYLELHESLMNYFLNK